ncbi:MAG TPA: ABC transporter substrate-binding protein [Atribacteraceae bacterium]|nr:ABC transporter substrate-binding protein [Atribacteraceae bacterium]
MIIGVVAVCVCLIAGMAFAQVKNPDTYIMLTISEPDTLDPHQAYDTASGEVISFVYDNLIAYQKDSMTEFIPWLSLKVPSLENGLIHDGGKTYVFPIREGVTFHNDRPLTPEDVEYTFERGILADPAAGPMHMLIDSLFDKPNLANFVAETVGVNLMEALTEDRELVNEEDAQKLIDFYNEYIDPAIEVEGNTVVFNLVRSFGPFLSILTRYASWGAILDRETSIEMGLWDGEADGWWRYYNLRKEESPIFASANGTGPFKLVNWDRAQQKVILERFDGFWGDPAKIKTAVIWGIEEWGTRRAMLEAGDADQIHCPQQFYEQVMGLPNIDVDIHETVMIDAMQLVWEVGPGSPYLGSGQLDGEGIPPDFFSDVHVRRAFNFSLDYDTLINVALSGLATRLPSVLPKGFMGWNEDQVRYEFDLKKAREEFQKAWGGKLWETGFKITLFYNIGNERRRAICEMLQENIESLNPKFQVEVVGLEWPTLLDAYRNEHMPAFIMGWMADFADPHNFIYAYLHSKGTFGAFLGQPFRDFAEEHFNSLIEQAVAEVDPKIREALYEKIQLIAYEHAAFGIPLLQPRLIFPRRGWVQDWDFHPMRPGEVNFLSVWKAE